VADLFLAGKLKDRPTVKAADVAPDSFAKLAGVYREKLTDAVIRVSFDPATKALRVGAPPRSDGANVSRLPTGHRPTPRHSGAGRRDPDYRERRRAIEALVWEREAPFEPSPRQLAEFAGDYVCDELGGLVYTVYVDGEALKVRAGRRSGSR